MPNKNKRLKTKYTLSRRYRIKLKDFFLQLLYLLQEIALQIYKHSADWDVVGKIYYYKITYGVYTIK